MFALLRPKALSCAAAAVLLLTVGVVVGTELLLPNGEIAPTELPNLDLMVDEEFLGIGHYGVSVDVERGLDLSSLTMNGKEE